MARKRRIAIFGGSFDPIHTGHILIAEAAVAQFTLDTVLFIPATRSPHKQSKLNAPGRHRLAMVKAAIRGRRGLSWDDVEINRGGLSFTIDTIIDIAKRYPDARIYLLIGSDNLRTFHDWKDPDRIMRHVHLIVYTRWTHPVTKRLLGQWNARLLKGPEIFISSTAIRQRLSSGRTVRYFVPPSVERYIRRHRLYTTRSHGYRHARHTK